jgi:hypothetical protein
MSAENVELPGNEHRWSNLGESSDTDERVFRCRDCGVTVRVRGYHLGDLSFVDGDGFLAFASCLPAVETRPAEERTR